MAALCKHCDECAVDEEDDVCHNCGVVSGGIRFDETNNPFCTDALTTFHKYDKKKKTAGLEYGMDILNMLSLKYSVSAEIKINATALLEEAYKPGKFKRRSDIGVLAGCCLIHSMKQNRVYVSLVDLCKKLKCTKKEAFKFEKFLKAHLQNSSSEDIVQQPEVEEITIEKRLEFSVRSFLETVNVENKEELIKKTIALTQLAESCWLISGRSPEGVICASAFLCWVSMNKSRQKCTYISFCSDYSLPSSKGMRRVKELKELLLKLGQKIRSFSRNPVTKQNVLCFLDYILENSESLRNDLLPDEFTSEEIDKKEFSSFRKIEKKYFRKEKQDPEPEGKMDDTTGTGASEIEISDTEISSYIRTDEQVKMIRSLQKQKKRIKIPKYSGPGVSQKETVAS